MAMTAPSQLPSFSDPPVTEVVVSVQFDPLPALDVVRLGLMWERFQNKYPAVAQKAPLAPVIERLGVRRPIDHVQIEFQQELVVPRLWFVSEQGNDLLQVQSDRFIRNWRRVKSQSVPYPRYQDYVRPQFLEDYQTFLKFLTEQGVDGLPVVQCELAYINNIFPGGIWESHADIASVFSFWDSESCANFSHPLEAVNIQMTQQLKDSKDEFLGRLHVSIQSVFTVDEGSGKEIPAFRMTLTARGQPTGAGTDGIAGFLDLGRNAIVTYFAKLTTTQMHKAWGRIS